MCFTFSYKQTLKQNIVLSSLILFVCLIKTLESFVPLKIKKVIMQTRESGEEPPNLKLKANNAIFFMSFKCNGDDPSGEPRDYQAMVRKTMDGKPGHIRLEVDCWAGTL